MPRCHFATIRIVKLLVSIIPLVIVPISVCQEQPALLRLQRSKLAAEVDPTGGMRGKGGNILTLQESGLGMGTAAYPSSASCLVVYNDGRYALEKRDEQKVGNPKVKSAEGTLGADDLQKLQSILNSDDVKKIMPLKAVEPPERAVLLREAETVEVQITREGGPQHFIAMKKRFKTQAPGSSDLAAAPSTGLDTYLDNASAYRKTLNPLVKWFEEIEKKSKSSLKDAKPQYCTAMTM